MLGCTYEVPHSEGPSSILCEGEGWRWFRGRGVLLLDLASSPSSMSASSDIIGRKSSLIPSQELQAYYEIVFIDSLDPTHNYTCSSW